MYCRCIDLRNYWSYAIKKTVSFIQNSQSVNTHYNYATNAASTITYSFCLFLLKSKVIVVHGRVRERFMVCIHSDQGFSVVIRTSTYHHGQGLPVKVRVVLRVKLKVIQEICERKKKEVRCQQSLICLEFNIYAIKLRIALQCQHNHVLLQPIY